MKCPACGTELDDFLHGESKYFSVNELAELMGVNPKTIYRKLWRKELPAFKIGLQKKGRWKLSREAVEGWVSVVDERSDLFKIVRQVENYRKKVKRLKKRSKINTLRLSENYLRRVLSAAGFEQKDIKGNVLIMKKNQLQLFREIQKAKRRICDGTDRARNRRVKEANQVDGQGETYGRATSYEN